MKLIFGLVTLFAFGLCDFDNKDKTFRQGKSFSRSFYSGFPNGSIVSFFFKVMQRSGESVFFDFYDDYQVDLPVEKAIPAHINVGDKENLRKIITNSYLLDGVQWTKGGTSEELSLPSNELRDSDWWRLDVYKLDDYSMLIWAQGKFASIRKFHLPINNIKSVYLFNNVDVDSVAYEKYVPTTEFTLLTEPTPVEFFRNFIGTNLMTPTTIDFEYMNRQTHFKAVSIERLPLKARLRIVAWFGSDPRKEGPKIQILPAGWDVSQSVNGVFTFYHVGNEDTAKGRKSYVDIFNKRHNSNDICTGNGETMSSSNPACTPVEIAVDGSTGELEHIWIQRIAKDTIKIGNLFTGPDRIEKKNRFPGTSREFKNALLMNMDQPLEIHAFNGATILHASIYVPKN